MATIEIFSTPTCPYCKQEKEYLSDKGIEFTDVDVSSDEEKAHEMIQKSGQMGVPVTIINKDGAETVIVGFNRPKLNDALGIGSEE